MPLVCKAECGDHLPVDGGYATCGTCKGLYHYTCGKTQEQSWISLSTKNKKLWKCPDCKGPNCPSTPTLQTQKKQTEVTLASIETLMEKMFCKKLKDLEDGVTFVGNTVEEIKSDLKTMQKKMIEMENRQEKLEKQNEELRKKVKDMEVFIQDIAQEKNAQKLEISGIPQDVDSNVFTEKIFQAAKVDHITNSSEYNVEKLFQPRQPGCGPVVKSLLVTFQSKSKRDLILETLKKAKISLNTRNISVQDPPLQVFVNEHLTPYKRRLFYEAKKIKGDKNYQYLWVKNGQILLKKTSESRTMRLTSLDDLSKI